MPTVGVLSAVVLAGCIGSSGPPSPGPLEAPGDCPFPATQRAATGTVEVDDNVHDIAVGPAGRIALIDEERVRFLTPGLAWNGSWDLPEVGWYRGMSVAIGDGYVAVAHFPVDQDQEDGPIQDPLSSEDDPRGVITFTLDGERIAEWEVPQVRGLEVGPSNRLLVLHDTDAGSAVSVRTPQLDRVGSFRVDGNRTGVREFARCGDRLFFLDSKDSDVVGPPPSRILVTDLEGGETGSIREGFSQRDEPSEIAAGHGLLFTSEGGGDLWVHTDEGRLLYNGSGNGEDGYAQRFAAHGRLYAVQDGALTVRPLQAVLDARVP